MTCTNSECPFYEFHNEDGPFSALDLNCLVTDAVKQVNFESGDVLFAQGQSSSSLFSLSAGVVKITSISSDGREQIVGLSSPGKLLVGLQSIDQDCHEYTAVAATDGSACKIRHRALLTALEDQPEIAMRLITALNAQLAHSRSLMEVMGHKTAAAKIASFILLLAPKLQIDVTSGSCCRFHGMTWPACLVKRGNGLPPDGGHETKRRYLCAPRKNAD